MLSSSPNSKRAKLSSILSAIMMFTSTSQTSSYLAGIRASSVGSVLPESTATKNLVIGTHDGSFHCDEALAIGMLKILPKFADANVVRTRKPDILAKCDVVVDVGAVYDPDRNLFDHHQREFTGTLDGYKTKLSSAGLGLFICLSISFSISLCLFFSLFIH
jgi:hypothetical protein